MAQAFEMLLSQPTILALLAVGVGVSIAASMLAARGVVHLKVQSQQLLGLARAGRADEARIRARQGTRDLAPMLAALGGELTAPPSRPLVRDIVAVIAVALFPLLAIAAGWQASHRPDATDRIAGMLASFAALAVLLPTAMTACTLIIMFGRRGARVVRGAAVQLLSRTVKSTVDSELSESLRRGGHRDPRGD